MKYVVGTTLFVLLAIGGGALWQRQHTAKKPLIDKAITATLGYPAYYPSKLPANYSVEPVTVQDETKLLAVSIKSPKNELIYITQQQKPANFDFDFFYTKTLLITRELDTSIGKVRIGSAKGRPNQLTASIVAEPTWIVVSYPSSIPQNDMNTIFNSLRLSL
jgi:hypothetical protein